MIEFPKTSWADYELLDSGDGEKLERFGSYVLARPEPKALWDKSMTQAEWGRLSHTRFKPGAGFGKAGKEDSGTWERIRKMDDQWWIRYPLNDPDEAFASPDFRFAPSLPPLRGGPLPLNDAAGGYGCFSAYSPPERSSAKRNACGPRTIHMN